MKFSAYIILTLFIMAFAGCESMITDVEIETPKPKIVVIGFVSPDSPYNSLKIYESRPLYSPLPSGSEDFPVITNATVIIYSDNDSAIMNYNQQYNDYRISQDAMPIIKGRTYNLKVTTPKGYYATSSCTVPNNEPPVLEIVGIDTISKEEGWDPSVWVYQLRARAQFKDWEGEGHFYRVAAGQMNWIDGEQPYQYSYDIGLSRGSSLSSDKNNDGNTYAITTNDFMAQTGESIRLYFTISITDSHYYNYHKTLMNFEGDNPFAEPTTIYSNIEGGLGVFSSYIQDDIIYDIR
jgi:hypothetical protein